MRREHLAHHIIEEMRKKLAKGGLCLDFVIKNDLIYFKDRLWLVDDSSLIPKVLKEYHNSFFGGSLLCRTHISQDPKCVYLERDEAIHQEICGWMFYFSKNEGSYYASWGLLMPLPIPEAVWQNISMDFIARLPKVNGKMVIMVVVNRLLKFCHLITLPTDYSAHMVAKAFIDNIVKLHGLPQSIVSDRDKVFTRHF